MPAHQFFLRAFDRFTAHERGEQWLLLVVRRGQLFRERQRFGHVLRCHDDNNCVNVFILLEHFQ